MSSIISVIVPTRKQDTCFPDGYEIIFMIGPMTNKPTPIAVVGMDGIFPGAQNLDAYWHNIVNGIDCSVPVPENRWIASPSDRLRTSLTPDHPYSRHACLIEDIFFDPQAFSLDPVLTRRLDPVHHLTLMAGKRAVSNCRTSQLDASRIHTIIAAIALPTDGACAFTRKVMGMAIEKALFPHGVKPAAPVTRAEALASRADGLAAALLAAEMGFGGDNFTLDAACASSLYAIKLSCDALWANRADMVVTGGVCRPECLYTQTGFSQLQALSPSGRCAPFDHRADGLVVGEGVGIIVLKRLSDAIDQKDTIHAVIRGIGLSNDMRGNLLAPEVSGQVRAMVQAYQMAGWDPWDVDLIECHGTGTHAGDTSEIQSLTQMWEKAPSTAQRCAIGSVKSMIGHLLTAAGAAGIIKTLLAMGHRTLPPSINFERPPADSPLADSPFRVQTSPESWRRRNPDCPRRAAVSAFGFGGINGHILFEQWNQTAVSAANTQKEPITVEKSGSPKRFAPIAIVGMDISAGTASHLKSFERAVFEGQSAIGGRAAGRWKNADAAIVHQLRGTDPHGAYVKELFVGLGEFQIPPKELDDILPQQLMALMVGAGALADAGFALRQPRERMGVVVGIDFDFEATNFHLRWQLHGAVRRWNRQYDLGLDETELDRWLEDLRDQCGPPLTPSRVVGALGGIVASRMAREFRFGGPSFVVSADAASGIKALQVAADQLGQGFVDAMVVGAVDLAGEGRSVIRMDRTFPVSPTNRLRPYDGTADGTLPGDGAAALVLKSLDRARADGDRIHAVIRGVGSAGGDDFTSGSLTEATYRRSLDQCISISGVGAASISLFEGCGIGVPELDRLELDTLSNHFAPVVGDDPSAAIALGATTPVIGHTGAASGLASVVKTALCLSRRRLAPLVGYESPPNSTMDLAGFHVPVTAQPWFRDRQQGPRTACVAAMTKDGGCAHVLLQEEETDQCQTTDHHYLTSVLRSPGLFVITGDDGKQIQEGVSRLEKALTGDAGTVSMEVKAARFLADHPPNNDHELAMALILKNDDDPAAAMDHARKAIDAGQSEARAKRIFFKHRPLGKTTRIALVYPGSGNHYLGMGRHLALRFPDVVSRMDRETHRLKSQFRPWHLMPWRRSWDASWKESAVSRLKDDPVNMISGQVVFGGLMTQILRRLAIRPDALIGYSLGESAALFANGIWADRGEMLDRMEETDLFTTRLAGPCTALRQSWHLADHETVDWRVAVVNRPADIVSNTLSEMDHVRLLIVNTPDECVIGGLAPALAAAISALHCQAVYLDGVVTVHCDAALPAADAYRRLHLFPSSPKSDLTVYSCSWAAPYAVTSDRIADSIVKQAVDGFDFNKSIKRAADDGIGIFIEAGPGASCSRMIRRILHDRPHLAVSASAAGENEMEPLLQCLAQLAVERVPMDAGALYPDSRPTITSAGRKKVVPVAVGGQSFRPTLPVSLRKKKTDEEKHRKPETDRRELEALADSHQNDHREKIVVQEDTIVQNPWSQLMNAARQNMEATAEAHNRFLQLSQELTEAYADTFDFQNRLLERGALPTQTSDQDPEPVAPEPSALSPAMPEKTVAFDRNQCMKFAIGRVGEVLGPAFDVVDTHRVRVRLPDEPLMLVDRILSVEGEMLSMESGRLVTEHDVLPGAWYLDGDRAPVCISVEAGQADLFLCSYLGIDHQVKGERAYRLLDATVTFHRGLPRPGDTIRYEIAIDRFVRQGETWMFFFRFEGFIGNDHLISMRDGCAGFFTEEEVANSGGIILTEEERRPASGKTPAGWRTPVPMAEESFSTTQLDALRRGDLAGCFGTPFEGISLADGLCLPDGRMRLIHRIVRLEPDGGRYGIGLIRAEADIHPDDWFLTCHFVDDMVMPGTLMYECCAHTLRVFLLRMGWVTDRPGACLEPVIGNGARLKCRGPVTPLTKHVHYEIQISEIGYGPEPYVIADAHMFADDHPIVFFKNMSMKMTGVDQQEIARVWQRRKANDRSRRPDTAKPLFDKAAILAFAVGNPSDAFGEPYRVFDENRFIARLPGPPYSFMDRVIHAQPEPWVLKPGGWATAQYEVPKTAWYFSADSSGVMPICVLLETALQPCGWLAAYAGSSLRSEKDLKFRNLGGSAVLHRQVTPESGTLTMRSRMTKVSEAMDMIIQNFDFEVLAGDEPVYTGDAYFGFFSKEALDQQSGLGHQDSLVQAMAPFEDGTKNGRELEKTTPMTPDAAEGMDPFVDRLLLPAKALLMIDAIEAHIQVPDDPASDYIRGVKRVDPGEWFFKAHFYQDPVCPGSLGIESFIQLMKVVAMEKWPHFCGSHRFRLVEKRRHQWTYRGQIIPENKTVRVVARVVCVREEPQPILRAEGLLEVDGLTIYKMENFELALVPGLMKG